MTNDSPTPPDDGGPAFPVPDIPLANGQVQYGANGMTLRDWFAGQALAALPHLGYGPDASNGELVYRAYSIADCMLSVRNVSKS
jgi:hypothetical protein